MPLIKQEGASDADISILPRYKYAESVDNGEKGSEEGLMIPILNNSGTSTSERVLLREDAVNSLSLLIPQLFLFTITLNLYLFYAEKFLSTHNYCSSVALSLYCTVKFQKFGT